MISVCDNFFRTVLGYNRDDRQWRAALDRVKDAQVAKVKQTVFDIEAAEGGVVDADVPEVHNPFFGVRVPVGIQSRHGGVT